MTNLVDTLEKRLLDSNRMQDIGSKRRIPSIIGNLLSESRVSINDSISDYKSLIEMKAQDINTID